MSSQILNRPFVLSLFFLLSLLAILYAGTIHAQPETRVKDVARVAGVRENQLIGYGLVVGLNGTGDSSKALFTNRSLVSMLDHLGLTVDINKLKVSNVAAVMITAELPPFVRSGDRIDVTLSSLGDAKDLEGGILLQTPLAAADNLVYAVAQGPVSIGGSNVNAGDGLKNHPTVAKIPGGAIVEREVTSAITMADGDTIPLVLNRPDFITASRLVEAINAGFGAQTAQAKDASLVNVKIPAQYKENTVGFVAMLEELRIKPDTIAKVVINERTGTIVVGEDVRISQVAVSHGKLSLSIEAEEDALWEGREKPEEKKATEATMIEKKLVLMKESARIADVVSALNAVGANPRDVIAILQAIKAAGALHAELIIM
ncbi:MAG: flagellar basal body P-ring protein FlgI [bacterium]|nr:flagellar basal body P-ring protein FlgI [bacterium]